jgi:hypothetical protein
MGADRMGADRMGANSFQMKGWAITIYTGLLVVFVASSDKQTLFLFVSAISKLEK